MDEKEWLEEIKNSLSLNDIEDLLSNLGGEPYREGNAVISRTVCHCGESHKLYYYDNTRLFRCYTECSDTFDVFQLIMKVQKTAGVDMALPQAIKYIINFFNLSQFSEGFQKNEDELEDWQIIKKYNKNSSQEEDKKQIVELKKYDKKILQYLPRPIILPWEQEGISREVIAAHDICYNPVSQAIVIPHYDIDGELVGIRERTLIKENEQYGKYRPSILNHQMYNHPLAFNLYNLTNSKNNIKIIKKAIIFEGEKSPLLYATYFGLDNDITVSCCGSSLSNYQVQLLLDLGVEEIIIAFDRQFKEIGDDEWKGWTRKLTEIDKKYSKFVKVSFMFDKWNLLGYKDAPIDKGKEIFLELFKRRVSI